MAGHRPATNIRELDAHFDNYEHLADQSRAVQALFTLRKCASIVKPIMRKRGWHVGTLCEFLPQEHNLLGLNINSGQRICLRLRHAGDTNQFMPFDSVLDTLLHELCHIEHGPHDAKFHALWNLLRDEHQALRMKGWSGEGFLSVGKRVGGSRRIPLHEVQRQARAAAEKRRAQNMRGSVTRLGGTMPPRGTDMRQVIADAVERRNKITKGCASGTKGAQKIADQASKGGLRTKAEVDDANNAAIARALQDLFERDEDEQLQEIYQPGPSGGLGWNPQTGLEMHDQGSSKQQTHTATSSPPPVPYASRSVVSSAAQPPASRAGRPISRLVAEAESKRQPSYSARTRRSTSTCEMKPSSVSIETHPSPTSFAAAAWNCGSCTFENHIDMPHCEMCGTSKPENIDLTAEDGTDFSHSRSTLAKKDKPLGWNCIYCNTYMETKWWTCSACGNLKPSS